MESAGAALVVQVLFTPAQSQFLVDCVPCMLPCILVATKPKINVLHLNVGVLSKRRMLSKSTGRRRTNDCQRADYRCKKAKRACISDSK